MPRLTVLICTHDRADLVAEVLAPLNAAARPPGWAVDTLVTAHACRDGTHALLDAYRQPAAERGNLPLAWLAEPAPGKSNALNAALPRIDSDILVFIDDDELPRPGLVAAAAHAIRVEGAQCVGGAVSVDFTGLSRPRWLEDDVLGFLAEVDYGSAPFWIESDATPVWTANIAYDRELFHSRPDLRFDKRYDRVGKGAGGGEDLMMFRALLCLGAKVRYRPDMAVLHAVEPWRLRRRYFLQAHYRSGLRRGQYELPPYPRLVLGVPPFMVGQLFSHLARTLAMTLRRQPGRLRQAMNAAHAWGALRGYRQRSSLPQVRG